MENCLVTKLKATVDNSNLKKLGVLKITATEKSTWTDNKQGLIQVGVVRGKSVTITCSGEGKVGLNANPTQDNTLTLAPALDAASNVYSVYFSNGTYDIEISDFYWVALFEVRTTGPRALFGIDVSQFNKYCSISTFKWILSTKINGNLSDLAVLPYLRNIEISTNSTENFAGDLSYLKDCVNLVFVAIPYKSSITGNITDLIKCTSLNTFDVHSGDILGTIEDFVAGQVANGRTSTSSPIKFTNVLRTVTFGGTNRADGSTWVNLLEWSNSGSRIVMYIGDNISSKNNATVIWAKGASAEEISAWEQAGKTVRVIE